MQTPDFNKKFPKEVLLRSETRLKDRVKVLLNRLGRSQNWLASEIGISKSTMSKIVNGEWGASSQIMVRMGVVLECDSVVLFGDSEYWRVWSEKLHYPEEKKNEHP